MSQPTSRPFDPTPTSKTTSASQPTPSLPQLTPLSHSTPSPETTPTQEPEVQTGEFEGGDKDQGEASTSTAGVRELDPDGLWFDKGVVVRSITHDIKSYFRQPWKNYTEVDQATKVHWWDMWKKQYTWRPEFEGTMRDAYETNAGLRLKDIFNDTVHKRKGRPNWLGGELYQAMKGRLNDKVFKERSTQAKANRRGGDTSGKAQASHCAGSVSTT